MRCCGGNGGDVNPPSPPSPPPPVALSAPSARLLRPCAAVAYVLSAGGLGTGIAAATTETTVNIGARKTYEAIVFLA